MKASKQGKPVFFRQKRDGEGELWIEGQAQRAVYSEKTGVLELEVEAQARRTAAGAVTDEVRGEHITYRSLEEQYLVRRLDDSNHTGDRRGVMVIQPNRKDPLNAPMTGTEAARIP